MPVQPSRNAVTGPAARKRRRGFAIAVLLALSLGGCACRPGYVGPYGGLHPTRCWVL